MLFLVMLLTGSALGAPPQARPIILLGDFVSIDVPPGRALQSTRPSIQVPWRAGMTVADGLKEARVKPSLQHARLKVRSGPAHSYVDFPFVAAPGRTATTLRPGDAISFYALEF